MIPEFVIKLFENEIRKVVTSTIQIAAEAAGETLDVDRLGKMVEKKLGMHLELVPEDEECIKIVRVRPRPPPPADERCHARIFKKSGVFCQCAMRRIYQEGFCTRHLKMPSKYGSVMDPEPDHPGVNNPLKKHTKIY